MSYFQICSLVVGGCVLGAILTYLELPILRSLKAGQSIREEGPASHKEKEGTPTMGGIAIFFAVVLICFTAGGFDRDLVILVAGFFLFGLIGFLDDYLKVVKKHNLGLRAYQKLAFQVAVALLAGIYHLKTAENPTAIAIPGTENLFDLGYFFLPFAVFVIVGTANAVNLTDGLDGLAAGTSAVFAFTFAIMAKYTFEYSNSIFFSSVCGASLGFLLFNKKPAKLFMGDTGSLALGGGMAIAAVTMGGELYLPIVGLVFVIETLSVIMQVVSFKMFGKRIFRMAPLHHHFQEGGMSENKVVKLFYYFTVFCAAAGLAIFSI